MFIDICDFGEDHRSPINTENLVIALLFLATVRTYSIYSKELLKKACSSIFHNIENIKCLSLVVQLKHLVNCCKGQICHSLLVTFFVV